MERSGWASSFLLLTVAAVSSGRSAGEYFQQARFQHSPSRPEDALVFFTATAPPLVCELEMVGDWTGGDRSQADLILRVQGASSYYACSFEGNATTDTDLKLIQKSLPDVFVSKGERKIELDNNKMHCTADSQLPDEYFHLRVQRPSEKPVVKCRLRRLDGKLYVRFPGYPTIICKMHFHTSESVYRFNLPGIVGDPFKCAFLVFFDMQIAETDTEERLYQSLVNGLLSRPDDGHPLVVCSRRSSWNSSVRFQVRLPGDSTYDCNFDDAHNPPLMPIFTNVANVTREGMADTYGY